MPSRNALTGAQVIVDYLIQEKVPQVFGLAATATSSSSTRSMSAPPTVRVDRAGSQSDEDRE